MIGEICHADAEQYFYKLHLELVALKHQVNILYSNQSPSEAIPKFEFDSVGKRLEIISRLMDYNNYNNP
jgi:murein tripeptide amidase MpaA